MSSAPHHLQRNVLRAAARKESALAALRRHEREQALLLDTVRSMIWFKDASNRILRCNRSAAEWIGKTSAQIEGRSVNELFSARRAKAYHKNDLAVIASGRPKIGELEEIRMRGGPRRWVQRDTIPYRDERGVITGVVIVAVDVTALKHAEERAIAKERTEREFLANVSHEFRSPVAAIKGFAQTLRSGAWKVPEDREKFLAIIESNADRLDALVGDLITLSAIEGAPPPPAAAVDIRPLLLDCADEIAARARRKGVALSVSAPRRLRVRMGHNHLAQALTHLLDNAVRFTPPGGSVRVRARGLRRQAKVWVEDNGIGIPRTELPRIFERFYRVAKGATAGNPGLGLHLVKKLVDSHGGSVTVKSRLAGGSSFCVGLPLATRR
jgi:two-component system phosphate regulon sensor histidine kinase PhoR